MNKKLMSVLFVSVMMISMAIIVEAKPIEEVVVFNFEGSCYDNNYQGTGSLSTILIGSIRNNDYLSLQNGDLVSYSNETLTYSIDKISVKPIKSIGKSNLNYRKWYSYPQYCNYHGCYYYNYHYEYEEWETFVEVRIGKMKYIGELIRTMRYMVSHYDGEITSIRETSHLQFENLQESCYLYDNNYY